MEVYVNQIIEERKYQDKKWGGLEHDKSHNLTEWKSYMIQYTGRALNYPLDIELFKKNIMKVAALAVALGESRELNRDAILKLSVEKANTFNYESEYPNSIIVKLAKSISEINEGFCPNAILENLIIDIVAISLKTLSETD